MLDYKSNLIVVDDFFIFVRITFMLFLPFVFLINNFFFLVLKLSYVRAIEIVVSFFALDFEIL